MTQMNWLLCTCMHNPDMKGNAARLQSEVTVKGHTNKDINCASPGEDLTAAHINSDER